MNAETQTFCTVRPQRQASLRGLRGDPDNAPEPGVGGQPGEKGGAF